MLSGADPARDAVVMTEARDEAGEALALATLTYAMPGKVS